MSINVVDLIESKKRGQSHSLCEYQELVKGFTSGAIPDYQMSAWLMAVCLRGMSDDETIDLTRAMVESGNILDLSNISGLKLDKHSSGGVGDKVTLCFVPILAAAGVPIAKMSGHGLGHTGGTLDKLESIPGFRTQLSEQEIRSQVEKIGACICAQTDTLAPADRVMYALRDVTGTVDSIPLIASSIMSKKIACGADVILLDIKVGSGAFMKTVEQARELAAICVKIGKSYGKRTAAFLTDMNQPLGRMIGNAIEVDEAITLLKNNYAEPRFKAETITLCNEALKMAGNNMKAEDLIASGAAFAKLDEIVNTQGGDLGAFSYKTGPVLALTSPNGGLVQRIDALAVGHAAALLGAGRKQKGDKIDHNVGIKLERVQGETIEPNQAYASISNATMNDSTREALRVLASAFTIDVSANRAGYTNEPATPIIAKVE